MGPFVERLVVVNRLFAVLGRRKARLDPSRVQRGAEIVTVVAAVADQNTAGWQLLEQQTSAGMIAHLALGQQQDNGLAPGVAHRVELGVQPALGASDATRSPPFLRRLQAVRCALRCVASIMIQFGLGPSPASSANIRPNTPRRLQRTKRLYSVLCGPYAVGASFHRKPLRIT